MLQTSTVSQMKSWNYILKMSNSSDSPNSPSFSWDIPTVPWTDVKRNREDYIFAFRSWESFHNKLHKENNNKITEEFRGIMLYSLVYGRAKDLCKDIAFVVTEYEDGVERICNSINKRDAPLAVDSTYHDFSSLLSMLTFSFYV